MFWLSFIPQTTIFWIIHGLLITGLIVYFGARFAGTWKFIVSPIALIVVLCAIFFEGFYYSQKEYLRQIEEYQNKVRDAEEKSKETNTLIKTKYIEKVKVVKETADENIKYIDRIVTQYDNSCTLSNAAILLHDSSSQNVMAGSAGGTDEGTSDVKISQLLKVITDNYATYYQTREQLIGFQEWYKEQKKIYESVK